MAQSRTPNAQLEAALVQFGQSSTPEQEAQLRFALRADRELMADFNQAALAGQVRGFTVDPTGKSHAGSYDIASGVITLPADAFQPTGNRPGADMRGSLHVQEMMVRFGHSDYMLAPTAPSVSPTTHPMTQDMLDNFQRTLNESPVAAAEAMRAATTVDPDARPRQMLLQNFGFVPWDMDAGGTYNPGTNTLNLPPLNLQAPAPGGPGNFRADDLAYVIGHEVNHSFNSVAKQDAREEFDRAIGVIARSPDRIHDYTPPVEAYIEASRQDEARASIAGMNALVSRQQEITGSTPTLASIYALTTTTRQQDFMTFDAATNSVVALPNLTFNPDATLTETQQNVDAMGVHYFNRPVPANALPGDRPLTIGERGTSDYPNYYGTFAIEQIIDVERAHEAQRGHTRGHGGTAHEVTLDMGRLKLSESLMEQEGIKITRNPGTPQIYFDSSQTPAVQGTFHHTQDGSANPAHDHTHVPVRSSPSAGARTAPDDAQGVEERREPGPRATSPAEQLSSPDQQLHQRIFQAGRAHGLDEERSANLAAQGVLAFKEDRVVKQADDVGIYGGNLYITSFPFGKGVDPNQHTAPLNVDAASKVPEQQSLNQALELDQRQQTQQQTLTQPTQTQDPAGPAGPTMGARSL